MKPKPFESLNHFTVPVVRMRPTPMSYAVWECGTSVPTDTTCFVIEPSRGAARRPRSVRDQTQKGLLAIRQAPKTLEELVHAHGACVAIVNIAAGTGRRNAQTGCLAYAQGAARAARSAPKAIQAP